MVPIRKVVDEGNGLEFEMSVALVGSWNKIWCPLYSFVKIIGLNLFREEKRWTSTKTISPREYCARLVRKQDYPQYVCGLLLDPEPRRFVYALRAMNIEVLFEFNRSK